MSATAAPKRWLTIPPRERLRQRFFPNVSLVTHEGRRVRFYDDCIKGKVVTINFTYMTCTGMCPAATDSLLPVQQALGEHLGRSVFMYSLTLKPAEDSLAMLRAHAKEKKMRRGWTLLTGKFEEIQGIRKKLGIINTNPADDPDPLQHTRVVRYGNEPLMIWSIAPMTVDPKRFAAALIELAARGRR